MTSAQIVKCQSLPIFVRPSSIVTELVTLNDRLPLQKQLKCIKRVPTCSESSPCQLVGFQEFIALACTLLGYASVVTGEIVQ